MDEIIKLINNITPADVLAMQQCLRAKDETGMPSSVVLLFKAFKVCTEGLGNLARYQHHAPLNELDQLELYQVMFEGKAPDGARNPLVGGLVSAAYRFIQTDPAGKKNRLELSQEELTPMMVASLSVNQAQLMETLKRIVFLQNNYNEAYDADPFAMDEMTKAWLVNSESYAYQALRERKQTDLGKLDDEIEAGKDHFEMEVDKEFKASQAIEQAKSKCATHLLSIRKKLVAELKQDDAFLEMLYANKGENAFDKSYIETRINDYIKLIEGSGKLPGANASILEKKYLVMSHAVNELDSPGQAPTKKFAAFHDVLSKHADVIAMNNDSIDDKFMAAMSKLFKFCHLPVPSLFMTQGERLLSKLGSLSIFESKEEKNNKIIPPQDISEKDLNPKPK